MNEAPVSPSTLIDQAAVLIRGLDLDGRCDYVNAAWSRFTGRSARFELGDGWTAGIHPDDRPAAITAIMRSFKRRTPYEVEYRLRRFDRAYRWIVDRGVPLRIDGAFRGFLAASIDVHDQREALRAQEATLRVVAAELRTPLQAARVLTELARRHCEAGDVPDESILEKLDEQFERFHELLSRLSFSERERRELGEPLRHAACSPRESPSEVSRAEGRRAG
jgi:PAS domain S-box-containing protein